MEYMITVQSFKRYIGNEKNKHIRGLFIASLLFLHIMIYLLTEFTYIQEEKL